MHVDKRYKYSELTDKIIGCAYRVHRTLGCGFQEVIYQRALAIEFQKAGLEIKREPEITIYYDEQDIGTRRVDFLIEDKVMVELKAVKELDDLHKAQIINYLEAFGLEVALLINFGEKELKFNRYMLTPKGENTDNL